MTWKKILCNDEAMPDSWTADEIDWQVNTSPENKVTMGQAEKELSIASIDDEVILSTMKTDLKKDKVKNIYQIT